MINESWKRHSKLLSLIFVLNCPKPPLLSFLGEKDIYASLCNRELYSWQEAYVNNNRKIACCDKRKKLRGIPCHSQPRNRSIFKENNSRIPCDWLLTTEPIGFSSLDIYDSYGKMESNRPISKINKVDNFLQRFIPHAIFEMLRHD